MVTIRFEGLDRLLKNLGEFERQVPFALAQALNKSADVAREELPQIWAENIRVRNPNFLKAALTTRGSRATKSSLRVELYDQYGRGNLALHDKGGTNRAHTGSLAIPSTAVGQRRGARGVPKNLKPSALPNSFKTDGRRANPHLKPNSVYVREGAYRAKGSAIGRTGKKRKKTADSRTVKLMYTLRPSAPIRADVPLTREFTRIMRREMPRQFDIAMKAAMQTAFRR